MGCSDLSGGCQEAMQVLQFLVPAGDVSWPAMPVPALRSLPHSFNSYWNQT